MSRTSARLSFRGALLALLAASVAAVVAGSSVHGRHVARQEEDLTELYAREEFYQARPEAEGEWRGELMRRSPPAGPAGRPSLSYELVVGAEVLPVYAAGIERKLDVFLDGHVAVVGKLVDLSHEGFGKELWLGSISWVDREVPAKRIE